MDVECQHIADELLSTLHGEAWYGDSVEKILEGVTCEQAFSHPIPSAHSIWELVHHVDAWCKFVNGGVQGIAIPGHATRTGFPAGYWEGRSGLATGITVVVC